MLIPIGGLNCSNLVLRGGAPLPVLTEDVPVQDWFVDCLKQTLADRCGVILLAPHGAGKSLAITRNLARFLAIEEGRRRDQDANYFPRRVVSLSTLHVDSARELYVAMYVAAFDEYPDERVYRRTKTEVEMRITLINRCAEENVCAFVIDEAQTLSTLALEALRDVMATSESMNADRWKVEGEHEQCTPAGIGILLVATMELKPRIPCLTEHQRRWVRTEEVGAMPASAVPGALMKMLPAFTKGAEALGAEAWAALVSQLITRDRDLPVSRLVNLTRIYMRRTSELLEDTVKSVDALPWNAELFTQAAHELFGLNIWADAREAA